MSKKWFAVVGLAVAFQLAPAGEPFIAEMLINPPGTDDTFESIEIQGDPNFDFGQKNYYLVIIEGDGSPAGIIDVVIPLAGRATGSNGLILLRDNAQVLVPAPDPATPVWVQDFNPDIENGTQTYVLGYGDAPRSVGTDLDTNNDGILDLTISTGSFTVVDAMAYDDNDGTTDIQYGAALGGLDFGVLGDGIELWTPEACYRVLDPSGTAPAGWGFMRVTTPQGQPTGPFTIRIGSGQQYQQKYLDTLGIDLPSFNLNLGTLNQKQSSQSEVVKPSSFTIVFGSLLSGGLPELGDSDDARMVVANGSTFLITQSPVTIQFFGTTTKLNPTEVKLTCEARSSLVNLVQRLDMYSYATSSFEQVDERPASVGSDQVVEVTKTSNAGNYVGPNGEVAMQYRLRDDAPAFLASWNAGIDQEIYTIKG